MCTRHRNVRTMRRACAAAIAMVVLCGLPVAGVGVSDIVGRIRQDGRYAVDVASHDVMSSYTAADRPGRLYLTDSGSTASQRIAAGTVSLPWSVSATFTLNGPDVSVQQVNGATGMVGIRLTVKAVDGATQTITDDARNLVPVVAFTIPSRVGSDVVSDDGVSVISGNSSTLIAAIGEPGEELTFTTYVDARHFTMSSLAVAAVRAEDDDDFADNLNNLTDRASNLVDGLTNVGSQSNHQLIERLKTLRDREKELATQTIAERTATHQQAFDGYIDAYVGSYTAHLSGSIGDSTQLSAILGTAAELNGDTDVARSVVDLANAVNDVSAAYRHAGAADAVDDVIRTIERRGTSGLLSELGRRAGEEQQRGAKDYSAGQSQLSSAMIPYSMDFTDAYTARLKELGATAATASHYERQAIADVRSGIDTNRKLAAAAGNVADAMNALADASEHTGQASAFHQIAVRFADQLETDDTAGNDSDTSSTSSQDSATTTRGTVQIASLHSGHTLSDGTTLPAKAEKARQKAKRKVERAQAKAIRQQSEDGATDSLVDDRNAISMDDVMSYAGGLRSSFGAAADTTSKNMAKVGGVDGSSESDAKDSATSGDAVSGASGAASAGAGSLPISAYSIVSSRAPIEADSSDLIDETVELASAAEMLQEAVQHLGSRHITGGTVGATGHDTQYLLSVPVL